MAVRFDDLVAALESDRRLDEWIAVERVTRRAAARTGAAAARHEAEEHEVEARLYRDSDAGRGAAHIMMRGGEGGGAAAARAQIERAAQDAALAVGPPWVLPPPAAPARVEVADPDVTDDPAAAAERMLAALPGGGAAALARGEVIAEVTEVRVRTRRGFDSQYRATRVSFDLLLAGRDGGAPERARGEARRVADLALAGRLEAAARRQEQRAAAAPVAPGAYDLVLEPEAIAMPRHGWFAPLVAHADAGRVRRGLSRYRPGQPVFARRGGEGERAAAGAGAGERFTLTSDGTIPFGLESTPFGPLGEPVRRFDLVRGGIAAGLALDLREAALAGATANGGARNLVLAPGETPAAELLAPGARPLLTVHELAWLDVDPQGGWMTAGIGLATLGGRGGAAPKPARGGTIAGDLFELLGRARLSRETGSAAWFVGPAAIRIDRVEVVP